MPQAGSECQKIYSVSNTLSPHYLSPQPIDSLNNAIMIIRASASSLENCPVSSLAKILVSCAR